MKTFGLSLLIVTCLMCGCSAKKELNVIKQTTGPYQTNVYLIYDEGSKEAALIDPGWEVDSLTAFIKDNKLELKYIFITHAHTDHYYFVPQLKKQFPAAQWCLHEADYEKIIMQPDWEAKAYGQEWVNRAMKDRGRREYIDFDTESVGVPDIFLEGGETFKIGSGEIKTIHLPGHTPGGICYYSGNILFSGDMLFYRSTGKLDSLTSSREDFIRSVRKLYELFPDSTLVYPGHNQYTNIGSEKKENARISADGGVYDVKSPSESDSP